MKLTVAMVDCLKKGFIISIEVQGEVILIAKKRKDIMRSAETGSGKILPFLILISAMEMLIRIVAKELLFLIHIKCGVIIGGSYKMKETKKLIRVVNLLIEARGRLLYHLNNTEGFNFNKLSKYNSIPQFPLN